MHSLQTIVKISPSTRPCWHVLGSKFNGLGIPSIWCLTTLRRGTCTSLFLKFPSCSKHLTHLIDLSELERTGCACQPYFFEGIHFWLHLLCLPVHVHRVSKIQRIFQENYYYLRRQFRFQAMERMINSTWTTLSCILRRSWKFGRPIQRKAFSL